MSTKNTVAHLGAGRGARLCLNISSQPVFIRAREPVSPSGGKVVGYFPSAKNNRQIAWESQLEKRACLLFEFSPAVVSYKEQPITIFYPSQGTMRKYTPDFVLLFANEQRIYVEVKPASKLKDEGLKSKLQDIADFWEQHDCYFIVITDEELNHPSRQTNLAFLRPYLRQKCCDKSVEAAKALLQQNHKAVLSDLVEVVGTLNKSYSLIAQGHIAINIDQPINQDTRLAIQQEIDNETCLFTFRVAPDFKGCASNNE